MNFEILIIGIILLVSLLSMRLSKQFNIPLLILFIFIGILAGSEGIGKIHFDNAQVAQNLGSVALMFIIFAGGLETSKEDVKSVFYPSLTLSTLGVFLTAILSGVILYFLSDFSIKETLLFSAIISSTDAAAVMGILSGTKLNKRVKSLVEIESGSNDPMAYALILFILAFFQPIPPTISSGIIFLLKQIVLGGIIGYIFGKISLPLTKYIDIMREELLTVYLIAIMFLCFGVASLIDANGYLAIYIASIIIGNQRFYFKLNTIRNMRLLTWFMQIGMFVMLGLFVFPSELIAYVIPGTILSILLIILVRFVVVYLLMIPFKFTWKEKFFISWAGLKGAVPIIFATMALTEGVDIAHKIFNLTFYIVCFSVLIQGMFLKKIGKKLGVFQDETKNTNIANVEELEEIAIRKVYISSKSEYIGMKIKELVLPDGISVVAIKRKEEILRAEEDFILQEEDTVLICQN